MHPDAPGGARAGRAALLSRFISGAYRHEQLAVLSPCAVRVYDELPHLPYLCLS